MKILDTDHCIAILRQRLIVQNHADPKETIAITAISVGELFYGAYKSADIARSITQVEELLENVVILPYRESEARIFAEVKAKLEQAGIPLADADLQIASIALQYQATLVTHNQRHFKRVPSLALDDWL